MADVFELKQQVGEIFNNLNNIENLLEIDLKKQQLMKCEQQLTESWDDIKLTTSLLKQKNILQNTICEFESIKQETQNVNDILCLPEKELEDEIINECEEVVNKIKTNTHNLRVKSVFKNSTDRCNAFLEINSGAGGTESCDWAEMLMRMYLIWADNKGFQTEVVDKLNGEPGVYTARYAGENPTQMENINKVLDNLKNYTKMKDRSATFVCVLTAIIIETGEKIVARGECKGNIATKPGKLGGLTYGPIFIPDGFDEPMSEMEESTYESVHNHRDIAMKELIREFNKRGLSNSK